MLVSGIQFLILNIFVVILNYDFERARNREPLADCKKIREQVEAVLAKRDFMPAIEAITAISSVATPSDWSVQTDRGPSTLKLRSEQDIRRLSDKRLLVSDADGLHYLIRDTSALDRSSRRLLDHFL